MTHVRFFNPGLIYKKHEAEFDAAIKRVLTNGDLILRQDVEDFERNLADFLGVKYAIGLNSGTDALYLSLWALGIKQGDEVLVPSHTFVATAQVVAQLGAHPVLYDLGGVVEFNEHTKAIIPVHITGEFGANMSLLMDEAKKRNVWVIEDACQALGAVQDKVAGTYGITGCFSFYPAKILGAFGDAGAVVTNDDRIYREIIELRNHYKSDYSKWGINSRLDNLQAAVLNVRIKHLPEMLARRKEIAERYLRELDGIVGLPRNPEGRVWQDFVITSDRRDELYEYLKSEGIETMKNEYPMPILKLPKAWKYETESLRIPCNDVLTDDEVSYVIEKIKNF